MDPLIEVLSYFSYINHIHNILYSIFGFNFCKVDLKQKFIFEEISRQKLLDFYNFLQSCTVVSLIPNAIVITF